MARATFVQKARKDVPGTDIKKGDSYYWWKFMQGGRGGPKRYSKTPPKRSQLTQSEYYGALYDLQDRMNDLTADDSLPGAVEELANDVRQLGEEQSDKLSNMPESLQYAPSGELLQERADACEESACELEGIDLSEYDVEEHGDEFETEQEYWENRLEEVLNVSIGEC